MLFSHAGSPLKTHSQLRRQINVNASDIQIFVGHLIVVGLVKNKHGKILEHKLFDKDTILWQNIVKKYLPEYSSEPAHI